MYDGNSCFKKKKRSGLFGVGGGVGGTSASSLGPVRYAVCCSAHVSRQNNTHSLLKNSLFHTSLSLHISLISGRKKKKKKQPGRISLFWSCDCFQQDGQMYKHSACLPSRSGRKTKQKDLRLPYSAHADGGRRQREPANEETRGKSCLRRVYSSVNLQGRTDIL